MGLGFLFVFCSFNILSGLGGGGGLHEDVFICRYQYTVLPFERYDSHLVTALDHKA